MLLKDSKNSRNLDIILAIILIGFCIAFYKFSKVAIRAGRLKELLISTSILILTYFIEFKYLGALDSLITLAVAVLVPLGIYSIYWFILLNIEKVTSDKVCLKWADRDWWWNLDGWEFEEEVARVFRLNGYKVKVTKKTGDGGIDLIMYKDDKKYIVQCKHYTNEVPVEPVRALNGVKDDFGADILMMIASSGITKAGRDFVKDKPYFKVLNLEDIIALALRPNEVKEDDEDIIDAEVIKEGVNSIPVIFHKP